MTGLSDLSDDDLKALYAQQQQPAQPMPLSSISDDELKALYAQRQSQATHADTFWGNVGRGYWPTAEQTKALALDAAQRMKTGIKETVASIPVIGASVPRDAAMEKYEAENPGITAINRIGGGAAVALPLAAAAPGLVGAEASMPWAARAAAGAASNAGISAADTKLRGGSEQDATNNAIVSGLIGGAFPAAGALGRGVSPYAAPIVKATMSAETMHVPGGWLPETLAALYTHGMSEIPLTGFRIFKGVRNGLRDAAAQGITAPEPSAEALMRGALARQAIANALTQQNQPGQ